MVTYKKEFAAEDAELDNVLAFIEDSLMMHGCSMKTQMMINVCVEEIFVNIAHYAYEGMENKGAYIQIDVEGQDATITFVDSGIEFDPLAKEDPDITAKAEDRGIGGLGIYMVKKSMDACKYERKDGQNIFSITKFIG